MELTVRLADGRILVDEDRRSTPTAFGTEAEAAHFVAYHVANKARRFGFDASCHEPSRHARIGFDPNGFARRVETEVHRIRASLSAMAA